MVGSARSLLLLLASSLLFTRSSCVPDPAQVDWSECEKFSCFVPGTCVGHRESLMQLARRPFDNCTVGLRVEIKAVDHFELTVVSDVQTKEIKINWDALKSCFVCNTEQFDATEPEITFGKIRIKTYKPVKTAKGVKCTFGIKPHTAMALRDAMFEATKYESTFDLVIANPADPAKPVVYVGYTEFVKKEIQFRVPNSEIDWSVCRNQTCLTAGNCDRGPEYQLKVALAPEQTCKNGIQARIVNVDEWKLTIYVDANNEIKEEVVFQWITYDDIFKCNINEKVEKAEEVSEKGYTSIVIKHIPYYVKEDNKVKCTFTFLSYIDQSTQNRKISSPPLHIMLYVKSGQETKMLLKYTTVDASDNSKETPVVFTGWTEDAHKARAFSIETKVCVGCKEAAIAPDSASVIYTSGPCEKYTCKDAKAKMNVNDRFRMSKELVCIDSVWFLETYPPDDEIDEYFTTNRQLIDNLANIECTAKYDCQRHYRMRDSCGKMTPENCQKPVIAKESFNTKCETGYTLYLFKNGNPRPISLSSIRCDEEFGHWDAFLSETKKLEIKENGALACVRNGYKPDNSIGLARSEVKEEETAPVMRVALYTLAAVVGVVALIFLGAYITFKIGKRKEMAVGMGEIESVASATPVLTVQKMDLKRQAAMALT